MNTCEFPAVTIARSSIIIIIISSSSVITYEYYWLSLYFDKYFSFSFQTAPQ